MTNLWRRLFPIRSLAKVNEATPVRVRGKIASPNALTSPLTRFEHAAARWWLLVEELHRRNVGGQVFTSYRTYAAGWLGASVMVQTEDGLVLVPLAHAELGGVDPSRSSPTMLTDIPPMLEPHLTGLPRDRGPLFVHEVCLRTGYPVELRAHVERLPRARGYREAGALDAAEFRAVPELGPITIYDTLMWG